MKEETASLMEQLRSHPQDWDLRLRLADALAADGEPDHAAIIVSMAPGDPQDAAQLLRAGRHLLRVGGDRPLQYARKVMAVDEMDAQAALLAAEACRVKGDATEAEKHYLVAIELEPRLSGQTTALRAWIDSQVKTQAGKATAPVVLQNLERGPNGQQDDDDDEPVVVAAAIDDDDDEEVAVLAAVLPEPTVEAGEPALRLSDEELAVLKAKPKRRRLLGTQLAAAVLAIVIHVGLALLLAVLVIVVPTQPSAEITAVSAVENVQEKPETKKIVVPQPTAATAAVARPTTSAITAAGISSVSLPEFDFKAPAEAVAEVATTDLGSSFSMAFQPKGTVNVNFFGIKSKGRRIAFLIEAERYMLTDPKGGIPAYQIVKEEIANMISKFGVQTSFNVLMFDHHHLSAFSERLVPATSANMDKVRDWIYPVNQEFEKIGLAAVKYPALKTTREIEPIRPRLLEGYMLAIQYALESDVDTVFIITSGWRHMARYETKEELAEYLKEVRWTAREEKAWLEAVAKAQAWLKEENEKRKAKGIPQRVIRGIHEVVRELNIQVRMKPGPNIDAEEREQHVINAMRAIYGGQGKTKPQINFVLFVGKDEKVIPMQEHFEEIAQRARGGKVRVLQGLAALKNVTGRK